jgi:hypothetical protein
VEERTTAELIINLGNDVDRCHKALIEAIDAGSVDDDRSVTADYGFFARQLVRAVFAYIEGITFSVKVSAAERCLASGVDISPQERFFAVDVNHSLDERGEVVEQRAMLRLAANVRFAFALTEKAYGIKPLFDPGVEWWSCLKTSIKVRDRLMHPKMPDDVDISGDEIVAVLKAREGFDSLLLEYGKRKPAKRKTGKRSKTTRS